jgi:hypothetical protein
MEPNLPGSKNWYRIAKATKGAGPLLLRSGALSLDPVFVGYQADDGRWMTDPTTEVRPLYFCRIPLFDADESDSGASA